MKLFSRLLRQFRRKRNLPRLVAERLRGEDFRKAFVNRVVRSMKENSDEWQVRDWVATHRSGVVVDARGYANTYGDAARLADRLFASITQPTFTILSQEEAEILGDAFDYLTKLRILESLGMDTE